MRHRIAKPAGLYCGGVARIQARNASLVVALIEEDDLFAVIDDLGMEIQFENVRHAHRPAGFLGSVHRLAGAHRIRLAANHLRRPGLQDRRVIVARETGHGLPRQPQSCYRTGTGRRRTKRRFSGAAARPQPGNVRVLLRGGSRRKTRNSCQGEGAARIFHGVCSAGSTPHIISEHAGRGDS